MANDLRIVDVVGKLRVPILPQDSTGLSVLASSGAACLKDPTDFAGPDKVP